MNNSALPFTFKSTLRRNVSLIDALARRDIQSRYRRSVLGPLWAIIQPLMLMVVFTMLGGVVDISTSGIPYVIFSYSVLVPWFLFSNIIGRSGPSIISNGNIIKKTNVSREVFPLVAVVTTTFDTLMSSFVLVGMLLWYKVPLNLEALAWLPLLYIMTVTFALGIGMLFASLGVYNRDFLQIISYLLQLMMYASPIIYPLSKVPERWLWLYKLNPLVGLLEGFRNIFALGQPPDTTLLLWSLPCVLVTVVISLPLFRYMSRYFADVL